jgi:transcriptional repressor NrdR
MLYAPSPMRCPFCATDDTRVVDSRPAQEGRAIRRRRKCEACGQRFTTFERPEVAVMVVKRDGSREVFDIAKVRRGMHSALADRPVPEEAVEALVAGIERSVHSGSADVSSETIGHLVLEGLRTLDEVAYLRFASVYKEFQGARDFEREVAAMEGDG